MPPLTSSVPARAEYDASTLTLWFRHIGGRYEYAGVPEAAYHALLAAPSKGQHFDRHIREYCRFVHFSKK